MPKKKLLQDYEYLSKLEITGVSRERFDTSSNLDYLDVICHCGKVFKSRRQDLGARFLRGHNIECVSCVNKKNQKAKRNKNKIQVENKEEKTA